MVGCHFYNGLDGNRMSAETFGFPDFYGQNTNAWIDCLTYVREGDGMSRLVLGEGEHLFVTLPDDEVFAGRVPEIAEVLLSCTAFVNQRSMASGLLSCWSCCEPKVGYGSCVGSPAVLASR